MKFFSWAWSRIWEPTIGPIRNALIDLKIYDPQDWPPPFVNKSFYALKGYKDEENRKKLRKQHEKGYWVFKFVDLVYVGLLSKLTQVLENCALTMHTFIFVTSLFCLLFVTRLTADDYGVHFLANDAFHHSLYFCYFFANFIMTLNIHVNQNVLQTDSACDANFMPFGFSVGFFISRFVILALFSRVVYEDELWKEKKLRLICQGSSPSEAEKHEKGACGGDKEECKDCEECKKYVDCFATCSEYLAENFPCHASRNKSFDIEELDPTVLKDAHDARKNIELVLNLADLESFKSSLDSAVGCSKLLLDQEDPETVKVFLEIFASCFRPPDQTRSTRKASNGTHPRTDDIPSSTMLKYVIDELQCRIEDVKTILDLDNLISKNEGYDIVPRNKLDERLFQALDTTRTGNFCVELLKCDNGDGQTPSVVGASAASASRRATNVAQSIDKVTRTGEEELRKRLCGRVKWVMMKLLISDESEDERGFGSLFDDGNDDGNDDEDERGEDDSNGSSSADRFATWRKETAALQLSKEFLKAFFELLTTPRCKFLRQKRALLTQFLAVQDLKKRESVEAPQQKSLHTVVFYHRKALLIQFYRLLDEILAAKIRQDGHIWIAETYKFSSKDRDKPEKDLEILTNVQLLEKVRGEMGVNMGWHQYGGSIVAICISIFIVFMAVVVEYAAAQESGKFKRIIWPESYRVYAYVGALLVEISYSVFKIVAYELKESLGWSGMDSLIVHDYYDLNTHHYEERLREFILFALGEAVIVLLIPYYYPKSSYEASKVYVVQTSACYLVFVYAYQYFRVKDPDDDEHQSDTHEKELDPMSRFLSRWLHLLLAICVFFTASSLGIIYSDVNHHHGAVSQPSDYAAEPKVVKWDHKPLVSGHVMLATSVGTFVVIITMLRSLYTHTEESKKIFRWLKVCDGCNKPRTEDLDLMDKCCCTDPLIKDHGAFRFQYKRKKNFATKISKLLFAFLHFTVGFWKVKSPASNIIIHCVLLTVSTLVGGQSHQFYWAVRRILRWLTPGEKGLDSRKNEKLANHTRHELDTPDHCEGCGIRKGITHCRQCQAKVPASSAQAKRQGIYHSLSASRGSVRKRATKVSMSPMHNEDQPDGASITLSKNKSQSLTLEAAYRNAASASYEGENHFTSSRL